MKTSKTITVDLDQNDVKAAILAYLAERFYSAGANFSEAEIICSEPWHFTVTGSCQ